ncbi:VCL1 [Symbiodinium microadriaticum]|nr:VCL1 [Symbiodinium microadriaticum]
MLQRVPASTEAIKRIGSTDPAALLYDAMEGFLEGDPKSDENIRSIASTNQLQYAVKSCINAASAEFDIPRQQALFRAASYGKAFCQNLDPTEFVETAQKLRVLNDVRREAIGLPLTIQQYARLTPEVKRLTATPATDEEIALEIKHKLQKYDRMAYLEVAAAAYHMGRRHLATMLLDMEQHAADQVPLLLSMQEEELALSKAVNSEDTDLIYLTLIHLERSRPDAEAFYRLVHAHAEAANLLKIYYRNKATAGDRALLHNMLMYSRSYYEAGVACMNQAYLQESFPKKLQLVKEAIQLFGQNRELSVYRASTEEQMDLMEIQKALEVRSSRDFIGLSLSETLANIYLLNVEKPDESQRWNQEAARIIKKFKVSEKMVWSLKVDCFSKTGQWELLSKLATEKKSPIGYKPFALACKK